MKNRLQIALAVTACALTSNSIHASDSLEKYGDIAQFAIPLTAGAIAVSHGDWDGVGRLAEGAIYTAIATHTLKFAVDAERPNGGSHSWPSGHTSAAMQGAAFLQFEYGSQYGIPAYLAAGLVGYSRVDSEHHYWRDVVAGALLATGIQYAVSKKGYSLTVAPFVTGKSSGLLASMSF
ncbi:phosphatase PAP2 family protein [Vibrio splendidus]